MDYRCTVVQVRSQSQIFHFWKPLAATWLMMCVEATVLSALIARLPDATVNLAAYGVTLGLMLLLEAPILMLFSASVAIARDWVSFMRLRTFGFVLGGVMSLVMGLLYVPSVFSCVIGNTMGLDAQVGHLVRCSLGLLAPCPFVVGFRRLYQGVLVRAGTPGLVGFGTVVRITTMAGTGAVLYLLSSVEGAYLGAGALVCGMIGEAIAARIMVRRALAELASRPSIEQPMSFLSISRFYYPLALTAIINLAVPPIISFSVSGSRRSLESLAVIPVINALLILFKCLAFAYQEVIIKLMGESPYNLVPLRKFATTLGVAVTAGISAVALTPLSEVWFVVVCGLTTELAEFSKLPLALSILLPAVVLWVTWLRGVLVHYHRTLPITFSSITELLVVFVVLRSLISQFELIGAVAAPIALFAGITCNCFCLTLARPSQDPVPIPLPEQA